jgi:LPXTG-site transpeptidase (sortase) family protein
MKLRFLIVFLIAFVASFAVLNSRFIYAEVQFWALAGTFKENLTQLLDKGQLPIAKTVKERPLPNQANLIIESIGVNTPIIFGVNTDTGDIYKNLENGVVHYSTSPKPGQNGVSVVLGHSSAYPWYKGAYGSIFALLGKLKVDDKISIQYSDGRTFAYLVKQSIIFTPFKGDDRLTQIEQTQKSTLVLISCWPVGTNYKRIAIEAEQI